MDQVNGFVKHYPIRIPVTKHLGASIPVARLGTRLPLHGFCRNSDWTLRLNRATPSISSQYQMHNKEQVTKDYKRSVVSRPPPLSPPLFSFADYLYHLGEGLRLLVQQEGLQAMAERLWAEAVHSERYDVHLHLPLGNFGGYDGRIPGFFELKSLARKWETVWILVLSF